MTVRLRTVTCITVVCLLVRVLDFVLIQLRAAVSWSLRVCVLCLLRYTSDQPQPTLNLVAIQVFDFKIFLHCNFFSEIENGPEL